MEGRCSTGQSPQRAIAPMEEEEEEDVTMSVRIDTSVEDESLS